jgi:hypothetical protein
LQRTGFGLANSDVRLEIEWCVLGKGEGLEVRDGAINGRAI